MPFVLLPLVIGIACVQYPRTCRKRSSVKPPKSPSKFYLTGCGEFLFGRMLLPFTVRVVTIFSHAEHMCAGSPYLASMSVNPRRAAVAAWRQPRASLGDARGCTPPGDGGPACFTSLSNGNGRHHTDTQQPDNASTFLNECVKGDRVVPSCSRDWKAHESIFDTMNDSLLVTVELRNVSLGTRQENVSSKECYAVQWSQKERAGSV